MIVDTNHHYCHYHQYDTVVNLIIPGARTIIKHFRISPQSTKPDQKQLQQPWILQFIMLLYWYEHHHHNHHRSPWILVFITLTSWKKRNQKL